MSDSDVAGGRERQRSTITFSEAVNNFDNSDITLENGTLTAISSSDGGVTWTGDLHAYRGCRPITTNVITDRHDAN